VIAAVVLAAGASTRFGSPKQQLLLAPVLERVRAARSLDELVVVLGAHDVDTDAPTVRCPDWARGPGASLRCGLRALGTDVKAAVVVLVDGPALAPEAVDRVVDSWRREGGAVVAASYGGDRGHPVLLARAVWQSVPDAGARALEPRLVPCDDLGFPGDVDEPPPYDLAAIDDHRLTLLRAGTTQDDWCLAEQDARLVLWAPPGDDTPVAVDVLAAPDAETATRLLNEAARRTGAHSLLYVVDDPAPFGADAVLQIALARACGFRVLRETDRWERGADPVAAGTRLTFEQADEATFFEIMGRTLGGTRDRALHREAELGAPAEAALLAMRGLERHADRWELARDESGEVVGVSAPVVTPEGRAVIAYVGVVPEERGRGYGAELLARATALAVDAGATQIRGDTDVSNPAMAAAFRRLGYARFARRVELELLPPENVVGSS
jgi:CTP:molybdopterin cytidylyltransferase MocA/RimJ/RimL family protein N-acetyltransferase